MLDSSLGGMTETILGIVINPHLLYIEIHNITHLVI
ncbi:hypothetical protein J568_4012, partial [Acinetobacter baumannii 6112]